MHWQGTATRPTGHLQHYYSKAQGHMHCQRTATKLAVLLLHYNSKAHLQHLHLDLYTHAEMHDAAAAMDSSTESQLMIQDVNDLAELRLLFLHDFL